MSILEEFRCQINSLDEELIRTLAVRLKLCEEIARFKKQKNIPMMQRDRIAAVFARWNALGTQQGIDGGFVSRLYQLILDESCRLEQDIIGDRRGNGDSPGGHSA